MAQAAPLAVAAVSVTTTAVATVAPTRAVPETRVAVNKNSRPGVKNAETPLPVAVASGVDNAVVRADEEVCV